MPQPKKPRSTDTSLSSATLDAQIEKLRQIVERAEGLLDELQRHEALSYIDPPARRPARLPVH